MKVQLNQKIKLGLNSLHSRQYFETKLSKLILENESYYIKPVTKFNDILIRLLLDYTKKYTVTYNSPFETTFHTNLLDFARYVHLWEPQDYHLDENTLKILGNPMLLITSDMRQKFHFWKFFLEDCLKHITLEPLTPVSPVSGVSSLRAIAQAAITQPANQEALNKLYTTRLRTPQLFNSKNRGRAKIKNPTTLTTRDLGILSIEETPTEFKDYFKTPIHAAKLQFCSDGIAEISKFMEENHITYISGPSGTIGFLLHFITRLIILDMEELKKILSISTGIMVAEGNHSVYEIARVIQEYGLWNGDLDCMYESIFCQDTLKLINDKF